MSAAPDGFHDTTVWLQVEGRVKRKPSWHDTGGQVYEVASTKVIAMTQSRPEPPRRGCVAVQVTLRIPDGAFLPLLPQAVITVPADMVVTGDPIEVDVVDPGEQENHQ